MPSNGSMGNAVPKIATLATNSRLSTNEDYQHLKSELQSQRKSSPYTFLASASF